MSFILYNVHSRSANLKLYLLFILNANRTLKVTAVHCTVYIVHSTYQHLIKSLQSLIKLPSKTPLSSPLCRTFLLLYKTKINQSIKNLLTGAISTEHSLSELRVIGTNAHWVDSYFFHYTMHSQLTLLCSPFNLQSR